MTTKLIHARNRQTTRTGTTATPKEKDRVLILITGAATREAVRSALESMGYPVTTHECPQRALCAFVSDPHIRRVIICGKLSCLPSNNLVTRARRLGKPVIPIMSGDCISPATILGMVN